MDDPDISDGRRDISMIVYFQEHDARHESKNSNTDPVEVTEPAYSAVMCLNPNVVAEVGGIHKF